MESDERHIMFETRLDRWFNRQVILWTALFTWPNFVLVDTEGHINLAPCGGSEESPFDQVGTFEFYIHPSFDHLEDNGFRRPGGFVHVETSDDGFTLTVDHTPTPGEQRFLGNMDGFLRKFDRLYKRVG